jgi:epoxide hydrolase 4
MTAEPIAVSPPFPWPHHTERVGELRLHWVEAGEGPVVILLHGFPDHWRGWRRQIPALAAAGFRVVVPDLRGYHRSERPAGIRPYRMLRLMEDVLALGDRLGAGRFHLAGHDWGGVVAWHVAMRHPERIDRLVVLNAPHPVAFRRELRRGGQLLRSWYALLFQLPLLPEWILRRRGAAAIGRLFRRSPVRAGAFSEEDLAAYRRAASEPGAVRAMLAYYRAALRYPASAARPVRSPTLLLWGERDAALSPRLTERLGRWVPDLRVVRIPDASHWVMADAPDRVSAEMAAFLRAEPA